MQHLEEGTIHAWLDGALDADESSRIERHVAECGECAAAVAEARGLIAGATRIVSSLDVVRGNVIPAPPVKGAGKGSLWRSLRLTPGRAALAASLLIAAATMLSVHRLAPDMQSVASGLRDGRAAQPMAADAPAPAIVPSAQPAEKRAASPAARQAKSPDTSRREAQNAAVSTKAIDKQHDVANAPAVVAADEPRRAPDVTQSAGASASRSAVAPMSARPAIPSPSPAQADAEKKVYSAAAPQATSVVDSASRRNEAAAVAIGGVGGRGARGAGAAGAASGFAAAAKPLQLTEVVTTGLVAGVDDVLGCYQIKPDSAGPLTDSRAFPLRFALQQTPGGGNQVRAVTTEGRMDSVIAGSRWERVSPNTTNVYWAQLGSASPQMLTLRFAGNAVSAQAATPLGLKSVGVSRAACRP